MSASDDVATMLALVPWLIERPGASLRETAEIFQISERQVRQHLVHLDFCGLPGLGGGDLFDVSFYDDRVVVSMADELRRPLRLVPREALTLVLVGEAVAQALEDDLPALRSALDKIRAAAGVPAAVTVQLEDDGTGWQTVLTDAIGMRRQVSLEYQGRSDEQPVRRLIDPWRIHVRDGYRYLQAYDHEAGDLRSFRLDRIRSLEVTADRRTTDPPSGDLPEPRYQPAQGDTLVELAVAPGARWLIDAVDTDDVSDIGGGRRLVRFHTDAWPWARSLCLVAGVDATIVSPPALAREVAAIARRTLERYA